MSKYKEYGSNIKSTKPENICENNKQLEVI